MRNLPNLDFLLIELIIKCKLNETQGQDWGVTLTKKLKLILIGKFKSVKFRNVKFDWNFFKLTLEIEWKGSYKKILNICKVSKKISEHTKIMKARSEKFEAFLNFAMPR
jgi:hypothetical protein